MTYAVSCLDHAVRLVVVVGHGDVGATGDGLHHFLGEGTDQAVGRVGVAFTGDADDVDTTSLVRTWPPWDLALGKGVLVGVGYSDCG